jgi:hypothetical protein
MANIFVSVPILGRPELRMMQSLYAAAMTSGQHNVRFYFNENDSLISRARNVHLSTFLYDYPECEYFMSIDSDLEIVNAFETNNIFNMLVSHDKEFVGGLYAIKNPGAVRCSSVPFDRFDPLTFDSGLVKMRWLSTGCWCIHRSVVEKMVEAYPDLTYVGDDNMSGKTVHGLYIPMIHEMPNDEGEGTFKKYLSEDWSFCARWAAIGGEIFADTGIVLNHIGSYDYSLYKVKVEHFPADQPAPEQEDPSAPKPPEPGFNLKQQE